VRTQVATDAGSPSAPSEDRAVVASNLLVIIDGATVRTDTGCVHGVPWYADHLASAIMEHCKASPTDALASAIKQTADLHRDTCDLSHPGTPSAAVGIVQIDGGNLRYLVLGDVTVVVDTADGPIVVTDDRVSKTAERERAEADALPAGSAEKEAALVRMKRAELAARNRPDGYWIAANDPTAVDHALTGAVRLGDVQRLAMMTDGATRVVDPFQLHDWRSAMDLLASGGPGALIAEVRRAEASDPDGTQWPRNKLSDDATAIYCDGLPTGVGGWT
jgi:hypothetical protein